VFLSLYHCELLISVSSIRWLNPVACKAPDLASYRVSLAVWRQRLAGVSRRVDRVSRLCGPCQISAKVPLLGFQFSCCFFCGSDSDRVGLATILRRRWLRSGLGCWVNIRMRNWSYGWLRGWLRCWLRVRLGSRPDSWLGCWLRTRLRSRPSTNWLSRRPRRRFSRHWCRGR